MKPAGTTHTLQGGWAKAHEEGGGEEESTARPAISAELADGLRSPRQAGSAEAEVLAQAVPSGPTSGM